MLGAEPYEKVWELKRLKFLSLATLVPWSSIGFSLEASFYKDPGDEAHANRRRVDVQPNYSNFPPLGGCLVHVNGAVDGW